MSAVQIGKRAVTAASRERCLPGARTVARASRCRPLRRLSCSLRGGFGLTGNRGHDPFAILTPRPHFHRAPFKGGFLQLL